MGRTGRRSAAGTPGRRAGGRVSTVRYRPDDAVLWTVPRSVAEVEAVRRRLELNRVHLLGHF